MINAIMKMIYFDPVGEGPRALPNDGSNVDLDGFYKDGRAQGPVPTSVLSFFISLLLLTACTKEIDDVNHALEEKPKVLLDSEEEFPIPELNKDNIKDVNAVLMEQLRQEMIDESLQQAIEGEVIDTIPLDEVVQPELEIEIKPPVFEIDPQE